QRSLFGGLGARLRGHQAAWRRGRDRRLLLAGALADEAAGTDRAVLKLLRRRLALGGRNPARWARSRGGRGSVSRLRLGLRLCRSGRSRRGRGLPGFLLFAG